MWMERSALRRLHSLQRVDVFIVPVVNVVERRRAEKPHFFFPLADPRPFFDLPAVQAMNGGIF